MWFSTVVGIVIILSAINTIKAGKGRTFYDVIHTIKLCYNNILIKNARSYIFHFLSDELRAFFLGCLLVNHTIIDVINLQCVNTWKVIYS